MSIILFMSVSFCASLASFKRFIETKLSDKSNFYDSLKNEKSNEKI